MIVADDRAGAESVDRAAAGGTEGDVEVADGVLIVCKGQKCQTSYSRVGRQPDVDKDNEVGQSKTHSSAAKFTTARLTLHAERVPAACGTTRHAKRGHVRRFGYAALICY